MFWRFWTCSTILLLLCTVGVSTAGAAEDSASAVLADCGSADLPTAQVDSCLERVRVLDETDPSAQLQSLEAQLEQRESGHHTASRQPRALSGSPGQASSDLQPYSGQPTVVESEPNLPPAAAEPDQDRSAAGEEPAAPARDRSGSDEGRETINTGADRPPAGINDDQPPVADPPDSETPHDEDRDPPGDS
jgi:hypothetical protein